MTERVLVVVAHPDDEVLGCGGALALHADRGDQVSVLILADGYLSRGAADPDIGVKRVRQCRDACAVLGVEDVLVLGYPDNRMDNADLLDVVQTIEASVERWQPSTVYTHHGSDVNIDHRIVNDAVVAACRPQPGHPVTRLLFCEVSSSTEWQSGRPAFVPNWYVDIGQSIERKLQALACYESELRDSPHPRSLLSVRGLAGWRGSNVGLEYAEAFVLAREIR